MGIVSQTVTAGRLTIVMGDGRSASVTREQIRAHFDRDRLPKNQGGGGMTVAQARADTIQWLKDEAIARLGVEQFNPRAWFIDFDNADGSWLLFGTGDA